MEKIEKGGSMMGEKYVLGCDFGTLSLRVLLVRLNDGYITAESVFEYPDGDISDELPGIGVKLEGRGWALQNPQDYLTAIYHCIPKVLMDSGIDREDVLAIGIDVTSCTILPIDANGAPLCNNQHFAGRPHAWAKLWKNHTANEEADWITRCVQKGGLDILDNCGGSASSEWFFPKVLEVLRKDPEIYNTAYTFIEAGDFIVYHLTGNMVRSSCMAVAKAFYDVDKRSFPSPDFFKSLDPRLENVISEKHMECVIPVGSVAGVLTESMAAKLGLCACIPVCAAMIDGGAALVGAGMTGPGEMVISLGTSGTNMMLSETNEAVPGTVGLYKDGVLPGLYLYDAGQSAVGDIYAWFCENFVPEAYAANAKANGESVFSYIDKCAEKVGIGSGGVMALDWFNGNRSILRNLNLTGMLAGLTLSTKPEEVYRALIESTAFGNRVIVEQFEKYGKNICRLHVSGGLSQNKLVMWIFTNVLNRKLYVTNTKNAAALACAIIASVAAGVYSNYQAAVEKMVRLPSICWDPEPDAVKKYDRLYALYRRFHDEMGEKPDSPILELQKFATGYKGDS